MSRKLALLTSLIVVLIAMLGLSLNVQKLKASETIYIKADGSVDPSTAPIQRDGNLYTFTGDINETIVVERSDVTVDGENHKVQGTGTGGIGLTLSGNNITIKNTIITDFYSPGSVFAAAIYSFQTSNNTIINNTVSSNKWGINLEWVTSWTISGNAISDNTEAGIYMRDSQNNVISNNLIKNNKNGITLGGSNNKVYRNSFVDNTSPGFVIGGSNNAWDDGYLSGGNYWSDYVDVDEKSGPNQDMPGSDGIWDHPYLLDASNVDRYPLVPEFRSFLITPLFMAATLIAVIVYRRRIPCS